MTETAIESVKIKVKTDINDLCKTEELDIYLGQIIILKDTNHKTWRFDDVVDSYLLVFIYDIEKHQTKKGETIHCRFLVQRLAIENGKVHRMSLYSHYGRVDRCFKDFLEKRIGTQHTWPYDKNKYKLLDEDEHRSLKFVVLTGETFRSYFMKDLEKRTKKAEREAAVAQRKLERLQRSMKVLEEL